MKKVIIISIVFNFLLAFLAYTFYKAKEQNIQYSVKHAVELTKKTKELESLQEYASLMEGYTATLQGIAMENIRLQKEQLDLSGLGMNHKNGRRLILLIDVNSCTKCLDIEMKRIKEKGLEGIINILINESSERQRRVFKNKYTYEGDVHYTSTRLFQQISSPAYVVCDLNGVVLDACVIPKGFPEIPDLFLDKYR
ncbi:hypothetical protein DN752_03845 [Echinicola strongylocentroti]|uniref:Uncharacterized protein n=1 Tax=Echinicola strongylocentroti TaxID=1795355 RepID=A0A2Z4IEJ3_9BACT|nr:hypothetical protein [Echinicola strongylocentroti]AWW29344.1 hypothetical protein DN752_03845 [Echinicola strongylocentroti]